MCTLECALQGKTYNITVMQRKILYTKADAEGFKELPVCRQTSPSLCTPKQPSLQAAQFKTVGNDAQLKTLSSMGPPVSYSNPL